MELGTTGNPLAAFDVDSLPEFIGGHVAMQRFIQERIQFPDIEDGAAQTYPPATAGRWPCYPY